MAFLAYTYRIAMTTGILTVATQTRDHRCIPPHQTSDISLTLVDALISLPCREPLETLHSCPRRGGRKSVSHHRRKRSGRLPPGAEHRPLSTACHLGAMPPTLGR